MAEPRRYILNLLLLIGSDVVQKPLVHDTGYDVRPLSRGRPRVCLSPVAFSFGLVALGFKSHMLAVGQKKLMSTTMERLALVTNYASSLPRDHQSSLLEQLLRGHGVRYGRDGGRGLNVH